MLNFLTCISTTLSKQAEKALARLCVCAWADPEGGGGAGVSPPPLTREKSQNIVFPNNTRPDPLKKYKVTKPAFNVPTAKRHLNGVSLAGRCWPAYGGIWIVSLLIN